jgi:hypothetical protein
MLIEANLDVLTHTHNALIARLSREVLDFINVNGACMVSVPLRRAAVDPTRSGVQTHSLEQWVLPLDTATNDEVNDFRARFMSRSTGSPVE